LARDVPQAHEIFLVGDVWLWPSMGTDSRHSTRAKRHVPLLLPAVAMAVVTAAALVAFRVTAAAASAWMQAIPQFSCGSTASIAGACLAGRSAVIRRAPACGLAAKGRKYHAKASQKRKKEQNTKMEETRRQQFMHLQLQDDLSRAREVLQPDLDVEDAWRVKRDPPPLAARDLASTEFLSKLRDGGPQALQSEDLPDVDPAWIGESPSDTARNLVNALCRYHHGDSVSVDQVYEGPEANRGREYVVTLSLADRNVFGSPHSQQVKDFDRDTTTLIEELKNISGWDQPIYKLSVQTPGTDKIMEIPDDLWKCEIFACRVQWEDDSKRDIKYLNRLAGTEHLWRLANIQENWDPKVGERLTERQREAIFTVHPENIVAATLQANTESNLRLKAIKKLHLDCSEDDDDMVIDSESNNQAAASTVDLLREKLATQTISQPA